MIDTSHCIKYVYATRTHNIGETIHGHRSSTCCGGKGMNQAIMAARMGVPCVMVSKMGTDSFGTSLKAAYVEDGIDIR